MDVKFGNKSAEISGDESGDVKKLADFLRTYGNTRVTIEGHSNSRGAADYNKMLSQKRANAVRDAVIDEGIDGARIEAVGHGEFKPIADNETKEGRAQNRRVVVVVKAQTEKNVTR